MSQNFWKKLKTSSKGGQAILALAPMAGVTDSAFRQICQKNGADVIYSEMANVSALFFNPKKTLTLVKSSRKEKNYVIQLFGKNPEHFAVATKIISEKARPDGIDINFGCPAKKVFGHGSGCALMPQKKLAREIISAVIENTSLPVSIKIRAGIGETNALEFIKNVADLDFQAVMVHGRTYEGKFTGKVDFDLVEKIKELIPEKIVLANGGITKPEDGNEILENHPTLDGLGIARGTFGQPWIFQQIKGLVSKGKYKKLAFKDIKKIMLKHAEILWKEKGDRGMFEVRKHLAWYVKGFPGASAARQELMLVKNPKEIKKILDKIKA